MSELKLPIIVTVIEAGPLEKQVRLLVESLRLWGGRLAKAPVLAVQPRRGPKVTSESKTALDRLDAEYVVTSRDDDYQWFPYLNKTAAVRHVATRYPTEVLVWLDADTLIIDEPSDLLLDTEHVMFAACATNKNIGTAADDDEFAPYFRAACVNLGVDYASLPYINTEEENVRIRAYWNSGVYAFAAVSGFADVHHQFTLSLIAKKIASHESRLFFSDQISLGLAAHYLNLPYRCLPLSHNFSLQPTNLVPRLGNPVTCPRILHYHGSLWPPTFNVLCDALAKLRPDVAEWLRSEGPLSNNLPLLSRTQRKVLELARHRASAKAIREATYY